jgi:hypothetical protein
MSQELPPLVIAWQFKSVVSLSLQLHPNRPIPPSLTSTPFGKMILAIPFFGSTGTGHASGEYVLFN